MKRILAPFALLLAGLFIFTSCLTGDDDYTYYDDTAITAFSLGTLNRVMHTTSSTGEDSTYTTTVDCSSYKFYIDQANNKIYNPDSLLTGIDAAKVICSISSKNSGTIGLKSMTSDSVAYFSSSDSIDFSQPREFCIYSNSGLAMRSYTVSVNVHQEVGDTCIWRQSGTYEALTSMTAMRAVALDSQLFVFGTDGTTTSIHSTTDGATWQQLTPNFNHTLSSDAYKGVVTKGGYMYLYDGGIVMRSTDGSQWEQVGTASLRQLVAASNIKLYAYDTNGAMVESVDDGATWTSSALDDSSELLPTQDLTYTCMPLETNEETYSLLIVGNRDDNTYSSDTTAQVWGRVEEGLSGSQEQPWTYYSVSVNNLYKAPRLRDMQTATYDGGIIAVGRESISGATRTAFDRIYESNDDGITWKRSEKLVIPSGFDTTTEAFAIATDSNNFIWLLNGKNGAVWRGRINRLGWATEQTAFYE